LFERSNNWNLKILDIVYQKYVYEWENIITINVKGIQISDDGKVIYVFGDH